MYIPVYAWTGFVCTVLLLSSMFRTQTALVEELGTCKPTVFQGDIMKILLNAVRIRWNNSNGVLSIQIKYIRVYTSMYTYIPSNVYIHTLGLKPCFFLVYSEQLGLPLHTAKGCQFTSHNMIMQDTVGLGRSPAGAWLRLHDKYVM